MVALNHHTLIWGFLSHWNGSGPSPTSPSPFSLEQSSSHCQKYIFLCGRGLAAASGSLLLFPGAARVWSTPRARRLGRRAAGGRDRRGFWPTVPLLGLGDDSHPQSVFLIHPGSPVPFFSSQERDSLLERPKCCLKRERTAELCSKRERLLDISPLCLCVFICIS